MIYEAVGYIGSLKITFGWLFSGGNIVSLGARKKVSFFPSSVEKNIMGTFFLVLQNNQVILVLSVNDEI